MSGPGILVDDESGVRFIHVGHDGADNSKSGKHGVGFTMSWKARGLWRNQGARVNRAGPRVISAVIELGDLRGSKVPFFFLQGRAVRQNYPEEERGTFWLEMQSTLDVAPVGCARVHAADLDMLFRRTWQALL